MTGSPSPSAYPSPSAEVWAKRAAKEQETNRLRTGRFEELRTQQLTKKQKDEEAKRKKKAADEAAFKKRQEDRKKAQDAERALRAKVRGESLTKIEREHQAYLEEEQKREKTRLEMARLRVAEQEKSVLVEDEMEAIIDAGDVNLRAQIAQEAMDQRRLQEEIAARHAEEDKMERERKAMQKEMEAREAREAAAKRERDEAYRIKKEMAQKVQLDNELAAAREAELKKKRNNLRKQNDDYNAWLAKGDLLRDEDELMHERREGSAMHKGARFSGIPDTKVDGKGNM